MRLFLLPISTRRTLIYCQRLNITLSEKQTLVDKATRRAAKLWADWEKKESGWQKKVVDLGNRALKRIPYEEWGLKSIPPLSARRQKDEVSGKEEIHVFFPSTLIPEKDVPEVLRILGTEREALHRKRMIYSFIGMPISAPIALIPVAWSHWRALSGSKHIQFLIERNLIKTRPSPILDTLYSAGIMRAVRDGTVVRNKPAASAQPQLKDAVPGEGSANEALLLDRWNGKLIAKALEMPELEIELDRAIWQVEDVLKGSEGLRENMKELENASSSADTQVKEKEKE